MFGVLVRCRFLCHDVLASIYKVKWLMGKQLARLFGAKGAKTSQQNVCQMDPNRPLVGIAF